MARYVRVATVSSRQAGAEDSPEGQIAANRERQRTLVERACLDKPDIVCMTEVITWYGLERSRLPIAAEPLDGPTIQTFSEVAREHHCYVIVPIFTVEDGHIYNSQVLLDRKGNLASVYHKIHPTINEIEMGVTPGAEAIVTDTDFGRTGFAICYDLNFRDVAEGNQAHDAEIVFFSSMHAGGLQLSIWAHDFSFFMASATPGSESRIVDPLGRWLIESDAAYQPINVRTINLDYRVLHLDFNHAKLGAIKKQYGAGVELDVARPEAVFCMYSHLEDTTCDDIIREFDLETRAAYFRRANRVRTAALNGHK
ncbi:MAG: hypothetical protein CL878_08175 [Dehalococcoidia bacterium]|nr:hypothetical protein [Dehalococcoidia bacterium]